MRTILFGLFLSLLFLSLLYGDCLAQEYHILDTEEAYTLGRGNLQTEVELGVTKQSDASELFNVPTLRIAYGLSEWADIEFEYEYLVVRDTDFIDYAAGVANEDFDEEGIGDLRIKLKVVPYEFDSHRLGFQFIAKLPNASQDTGLGTNETDFSWQVLLSSDWGRLRTHVNAGMAILGDPSRNGNQNDFVIWGVAGEYALTDLLTLMGEVEGSFAADNSTTGFVENIAESSEGGARARVRAGLTGPIGDWRWGVSAFKGVNTHTEDWGAQIGLSRTWGIGGPTDDASPPLREGEQPETYYNPLKTEEAYTIGERKFRTELEFAYINQPDDSDLYLLPDLTVGWGIGSWADFQIQLQYLKVDDTSILGPDGNVTETDVSKSGVGDSRFKLKMSPFETKYGRLGVQFMTKVASAEDRDGLGTDEVDFSARVLFSTDWSQFSEHSLLEPLRTHLNVGIAIQSDRGAISDQEDYLIWGAAAEYELAPALVLWAEAEGSTNGATTSNIAEGDFGNAYAEARLGLTGPIPLFELLSDWKWGVTAGVGLNNHSRDWSASVGLSRTWGL